MKNDNHRSFVYSWILFCVLFVAANAVIWYGPLKAIFQPTQGIGNLARLSYLPEIALPRKQSTDLTKGHLRSFSAKRGPKIDVVSIGDSYARGGSRGHNRFFQDYLASKYSLNILNINPLGSDKRNPVAGLLRIINSGYLDLIKPRYVILESTELQAVSRLTEGVDFSLTSDIEELIAIYQNRRAAIRYAKKERGDSYLKKINFINTANLKYLLNSLSYHFFGSVYFGQVELIPLKRPLFSRLPQTLAVRMENDIFVEGITQDTVIKANETLNSLARMLKERNCQLIFFPIIDKYTLYYPEIENPPYPKSNFFEIIRPLKKEYLWIDSAQLLQDLLKSGEVDIFYPDDTHWSHKATDEIFSKFNLEL